MSAALIAEARARLATALTGYADRTGDPHPVPSSGGGLPAFAVRLEVGASERVAMGDAERWQEAVLQVNAWAEPGDPSTAEAGARSLAAVIRGAIMADPARLDGTAWEIDPDAYTPAHDAAERRITTVEQSFAVRLLEE
mgnify:CR=1 FL=1